MRNQISCEKCFAPIQAENLNIRIGIAKCGQCGHSYYSAGNQNISKPKFHEITGVTTKRNETSKTYLHYL